MFNAAKESLSQINIMTKTIIRLNLRYKANLFLGMIGPIINIIIPLIVLGKFFEYNAQFGPWTKYNYMIFIFMSYNLISLRGFLRAFSRRFITDKYWNTLPLYMLAPVKTYCILFGVIFSQSIIMAIPFMAFFILCFIYYPISFYNILFIFLLYFLLLLFFSGMGLIIGVFGITNENLMGWIHWIVQWFFWLSCLTFPYQIFPPFLQVIINLNPFYHIFNLIRVAWIVNNPLYIIEYYFGEFLILLIPSLIFPIISVYIFNKIYHKYGIAGY